MGFFSKAKKLMSTVVKHYDTAKNIATMINDNLPEDMRLGMPKIDEKNSVKENTSKLVTFTQTIPRLRRRSRQLAEGTLECREYRQSS